MVGTFDHHQRLYSVFTSIKVDKTVEPVYFKTIIKINE